MELQMSMDSETPKKKEETVWQGKLWVMSNKPPQHKHDWEENYIQDSQDCTFPSVPGHRPIKISEVWLSQSQADLWPN